ncbi:neuronal acetylcholine receptor subunit alpha-7-like [Rhopilema esculentum]|uniref:neuronal acetylcholine receptor subunit alpha-7-like n=1 Tax=Rhopilema esculentum TaxID=499914 RepID=UPI0031DF6168|eukprot:gene7596-13403_t
MVSRDRLVLLCFLVIFTASHFVEGTGSEHDLKKKLITNYLKTIRPVKNHSNPVDVKFDIALRAVLDLEEKKQVLSTSSWIRIYWKDENLVWDPKNYSNIKSINFLAEEIWKPDVVLYNSVDNDGGGILDTSMTTNIIVSSDGSCSWFCPLILQTECSVDIKYFPFDRQVCPMRFGLWTYNGLMVNFSIVRDTGDTKNLVPSGEWNLEAMPGRRKVFFYDCCPNVPYPVIDYDVIIIRRTSFYLLNLIWPGILIAVLAAITFLLPPESGERIGLGITNLLAMMVFLLLISESIPPTSDAVPLASNFFSVVLVLSALALIESCIVIKFLHYSNSDVSEVPRFVRYFINDLLARLVCVDGSSKKRNSVDLHEPKGVENPIMKRISYGDIALHKNNPYGDKAVHKIKASREEESDLKLVRRAQVQMSVAEMEIAEGVKKIVSTITNQERAEDAKAEWRRAVQVVDRLSTIVFLLALIGGCAGIFASSPRFYVA